MAQKQQNQQQSQKFIEAGRELGCNMTQEEFAKTLKGIASMKPMTNKQVKKKAASRKKSGPN